MTHSLAREEADRLFSNKERFSTHPEDASDSDNHSETEEKNTSTDPYHSDPGDDEDTLPSMSATTTATYHLPHTSFDANTGPKGVIADAQSFDRAKKHSLRNTLSNFTRASYFSTNPKPEIQTKPRHESDSSEKSASGHDEDENDEFMKRWRQSRLKELSGGPSQKSKRRQSPSKKKWGFFKEVDADGYLDAVEKTSSDTVVVVCIYDPEVCHDLAKGALDELADPPTSRTTVLRWKIR